MITLRVEGAEGAEVVAIVNPVGAALVALEVQSLALVQRFKSDTPPMGAGITLAPWPNRVRDGQWTASGVLQQLAITEIGKPNAIHGFVRNTVFEQSDGVADPSTAVLETTIGPEPGWPYSVHLSVTYRVVPEGLTVSYRARNEGSEIAPFAVGSHPYFTIGAETTENLVLTVPADVVLVTDEAGIPVGRQGVAGALDLRAGRRVGEVELGHCYTALAENNGIYTGTLASQRGDLLQIWAERAFAYWMIYNPPSFPGPDGPVRAIAIEPMTAAPDALNSGEGLRWLLPGEEWTVSWGISAQVRPAAKGSHLPDSIDR